MPAQEALILLKRYIMGTAVNSLCMHLLPGVQVDLPDIFLAVELLHQRYIFYFDRY